MADPFIILSGLVTGITAAVCYRWGRKNGKSDGYVTGRYAGWRACEDLIIKRMISAGYDKDKIFEDLIQ